VREHLHDHALQRLRGAGVDADQHEAHVADRRVRDQALDVVLREAQERTVEDADTPNHIATGANCAEAFGNSGSAKRSRP